MVKSQVSRAAVFLAASLLLFYPFAQAEASRNIQKIDRLVIFPLENLSQNLEAQAIMDSLLQKELEKRGFQIISYKDVNKFLNDKRIRNTGAIDRITALELNLELGVDAVLMGSIDQYSDIDDEIYAGLSLRLIRLRDCSIIWMDTISYAGSDFTGLLGLGRVRSLDKLCDVVVNKMVSSMPKEALLKDRENNHSEIGNFKISPPVIRGGESAKVSVRVVSAGEKPAKVQAYVGGIKFDLRDENINYYSGEIAAPFTDGLYPVDIIVAMPDGNASHFSSAGVVKVDTVSPKVTISTDKDIMAGFVKKDSIIFTLKSDEVIEKWKVEIMNKENKYVRGGIGFGILPRQIIWGGENDAGAINNEGVYNVKLSVWDGAGNIGVFKKDVILDTTPPEVKINAKIRDENYVVFNIEQKKGEMMDKWEFMVEGENSEIIKKISERGNVERVIVVSLPSNKEALGRRQLMYKFKAIDKAGNIFETSDQIDISVDRKNERFAKKSGWDGDF